MLGLSLPIKGVFYSDIVGYCVVLENGVEKVKNKFSGYKKSSLLTIISSVTLLTNVLILFRKKK